MIVLYRKNLSIGWFRKYKLFIDNEVKDTIKPGEKLEINLDDGEHEIFIKVDWLESKKSNLSKKALSITSSVDLNTIFGLQI